MRSHGSLPFVRHVRVHSETIASSSHYHLRLRRQASMRCGSGIIKALGPEGAMGERRRAEYIAVEGLGLRSGGRCVCHTAQYCLCPLPFLPKETPSIPPSLSLRRSP